MKKISKYLLIFVGCCVLFSGCRVLQAAWEIPKAVVGLPVAVGQSLGLLEEEATQEKVVNGKVVKVNSKGEIVNPSPIDKGHKINVGYLVWWLAVFTVIALGIRHFIKRRNE